VEEDEKEPGTNEPSVWILLAVARERDEVMQSAQAGKSLELSFVEAWLFLAAESPIFFAVGALLLFVAEVEVVVDFVAGVV